MKIKLASLFISEKSGPDRPVPKMMVTRNPPTKNRNFQDFVRELCHQSNDSLAFQQLIVLPFSNATGQFSAIKPCFRVVFDLRTHPPLCNLVIVMGFLLPQIYWEVVFKPLTIPL